jgi:hypothetical protein
VGFELRRSPQPLARLTVWAKEERQHGWRKGGRESSCLLGVEDIQDIVEKVLIESVIGCAKPTFSTARGDRGQG